MKTQIHYEIQTLFDNQVHLLDQESLDWVEDSDTSVHPERYKITDFESLARVLLKLIAEEKSKNNLLKIYIIQVTESYNWDEEGKCYELENEKCVYIDSVRI